jgi:hypothetical protein
VIDVLSQIAPVLLVFILFLIIALLFYINID